MGIAAFRGEGSKQQTSIRVRFILPHVASLHLITPLRRNYGDIIIITSLKLTPDQALEDVSWNR